MTALTVTAKGQVTFRKDVLNYLGVQAGDKIIVEKLPHGRLSVRAAQPKGHISDIFDSLKTSTDTVLSIDDMNEIIAQGWAGKR